MAAEGPCLIIEWRDKRNGQGWLTSRYYPEKKTSAKDAELACFEWFRVRRAEIKSMTWSWGEVSKFVVGKHRLVLG